MRDFKLTGKKSSDPESPAYIPTIFNFTSSPKKRKVDQNLVLYEAAKRRRQNRDEQVNNQGQHDVEDEDDLGRKSVGVQCSEVISKKSIAVQTDMTMADLAALEHDCQQRLSDIQALKENVNQKAYPVRERLNKDKRLSKLKAFPIVFNNDSALI